MKTKKKTDGFVPTETSFESAAPSTPFCWSYMRTRACFIASESNAGTSRNASDGNLSLKRRRIVSTLLASYGFELVGSRSYALDGRDDLDFYSRWTYASPKDILPYVFSTAKEGDAQSTLDAMDRFSDRYPMYNIGPIKGKQLEHQVKHKDPMTALELGTFLGYSAIRTARVMREDGFLYCVEGNEERANVARRLLSFSGLDHKVLILNERASDAILRLQHNDAGPFDFVFLDHCKECYLPDLIALESGNMIRDGCIVMADNVIYPGAPGYLEHVDQAPYTTEIIDAPYEYREAWRMDPNEKPPENDAMSVSLYRKEANP